jgi:hypothetical protein
MVLTESINSWVVGNPEVMRESGLPGLLQDYFRLACHAAGIRAKLKNALPT